MGGFGEGGPEVMTLLVEDDDPEVLETESTDPDSPEDSPEEPEEAPEA